MGSQQLVESFGQATVAEFASFLKLVNFLVVCDLTKFFPLMIASLGGIFFPKSDFSCVLYSYSFNTIHRFGECITTLKIIL